MTQKISLPIMKFDHFVELPTYGTEKSSGADLYAAISEDITLKPSERILVPTGIACSIPEGHDIEIRPRSGLAIKHGITVLNTPGTIDNDYQGEIKVILINLSNENFTITRGMRIAQMKLSRYIQAQFEIIERFESKSSRGQGGFGSTGQ